MNISSIRFICNMFCFVLFLVSGCSNPNSECKINSGFYWKIDQNNNSTRDVNFRSGLLISGKKIISLTSGEAIEFERSQLTYTCIDSNQLEIDNSKFELFFTPNSNISFKFDSIVFYIFSNEVFENDEFMFFKVSFLEDGVLYVNDELSEVLNLDEDDLYVYNSFFQMLEFYNGEQFNEDIFTSNRSSEFKIKAYSKNKNYFYSSDTNDLISILIDRFIGWNNLKLKMSLNE